MVKAIGDNISMGEYNGLVYLLRKFKKIVRHETIGKVLETDIGTLNVSYGFINVGENFILENDVNIISQNCLPSTTYSFTFYIVNTDTSERVLETPITISGDTDNNGNIEIIIPENLLSDGEEIRRNIKIEVTFQEHEGVSPNSLFNLDLSSDKEYIGNGETATITARLFDSDDEPLTDFTVYFNMNGTLISRITNSDGEAIITLTGTGNNGIINIKVLNEEIRIIDYYFYDHAIFTEHNPNYLTGKWEINYLPESTLLQICDKTENDYCPSSIPTQTDITQRLQFDTPYSMEFDVYETTKNVYLRVWDGDYASYTKYYDYLIDKKAHYHLIVKEDVIQLWIDDTLIEKVIRVDGNTSVGFVNMKSDTDDCKRLEFANLIVYKDQIIEPPIEEYSLSLAGTSVIESGDSDTITCTLLCNSSPVSGETLSYEIKKGSTVLDSGSGVTDANGELDISYIGTGVGDVDVIVSYGTSLQETYKITDYWKIYSNEFSNTDFNNSVQSLNFTLPSDDFEIIWEASSNRSGSNNNYIRIGVDDNNSILFGVIDGNQLLGYYIRENGSYTHQTRGTVNGSVNNYMEHKITVVNGIITYDTANLILPPNDVSLEKFLSRTVWYGKSKNIKIKVI